MGDEVEVVAEAKSMFEKAKAYVVANSGKIVVAVAVLVVMVVVL